MQDLFPPHAGCTGHISREDPPPAQHWAATRGELRFQPLGLLTQGLAFGCCHFLEFIVWPCFLPPRSSTGKGGIPWLEDEGFCSQVPLHPHFLHIPFPILPQQPFPRRSKATEEGRDAPSLLLLFQSLEPLGTQNPPLPSETNPQMTN